MEQTELRNQKRSHNTRRCDGHSRQMALDYVSNVTHTRHRDTVQTREEGLGLVSWDTLLQLTSSLDS